MAHDKVSLVGHTKSYHQVLVKGNPDDLMGKRVKVRVTATTKHSMIADIIGEPREVAISRNYQIEKGPDFIKIYLVNLLYKYCQIYLSRLNSEGNGSQNSADTTFS